MSLTSSGQLSLDNIQSEMDNSTGGKNASLKDMSEGRNPYGSINTSSASYPDGVAPHSVSEFYSYDHSASSGVAVGSYGNSALTKVWYGDQGTGLQTYSADISGATFCGASVIGQTGHIYYRIESGTSFRQDAQIYQFNQSGYGWNSPGTSGGTWGYENWEGTRSTTNTTYNHTTGWFTIASGGTAGRWNQDTGGTPSGGTGVDVGTTGCIYYEGSGSSAYTKDVYLRSPEFTFNTNTIATKSYGYGSNMGTLYMGVYITG